MSVGDKIPLGMPWKFQLTDSVYMDDYVTGTHPPQYCAVTKTYKRFYLPVTYSIVFLLGLTLNGSLLWLVFSRTRKWSCSVVYMVNLAVADLLYVLALPLLIVSYAMDDVWPFGDIICKTVRFFFYTNLHCGMMFLMCISVHRFIGVCFPIKAMRYRTKKMAVMASGAIWVLVTVEILPTLAFAHTGFINNMTVCFDMTSPGKFQQYFPYGLFLAIAGFLLPFLVILISNCTMVRILSRQQSDGSPAGTAMRNKSVRTLLMVSLIFVVCFGPYHITRTLYLFVRVYMASNCKVLNVVMFSYKMWRPIVSVHCCVNPLLYFIGSDKKRKLIWSLLCRKRVHPTVWTVQPQVQAGKSEPRDGAGNKSSSKEG
ncbi:P2Y purinoceptor 3-like [Engraulis encrasicolus]|uniref:P2Y purinoceptor 3-like n=1 Tax=Engraulis encrasicolus TaxID=184585 RepID=UPI002FD0948B